MERASRGPHATMPNAARSPAHAGRCGRERLAEGHAVSELLHARRSSTHDAQKAIEALKLPLGAQSGRCARLTSRSSRRLTKPSAGPASPKNFGSGRVSRRIRSRRVHLVVRGRVEIRTRPKLGGDSVSPPARERGTRL